MDEEIRCVLALHAKLSVPVGGLGDDDDLFLAGLTSHANVNVMLALEERFEMEFPDSLLRRTTFESIRNIRSTLSLLVPDALEGEIG